MDWLSELNRTKQDCCAACEVTGGVYGWFVRWPLQLGSLSVGPETPIYIGRSTNLAARKNAAHLNPGATGRSTLRRSLGALLKDELRLEAKPRGQGNRSSDYTNFRFQEDGEEQLTRWMRENLQVGTCRADDPVAAEDELLSLIAPPLNLRGCANVHRTAVMSARRVCADEARGA